MDLMNQLFKPYLNLFVIIFIDDVLIYSIGETEHEEHLQIVLHNLKGKRLRAKFTKCKFWLMEVVFLGNVVNAMGVMMDPNKVSVVIERTRSSLVMEVQIFSWIS